MPNSAPCVHCGKIVNEGERHINRTIIYEDSSIEFLVICLDCYQGSRSPVTSPLYIA